MKPLSENTLSALEGGKMCDPTLYQYTGLCSPCSVVDIVLDVAGMGSQPFCFI
jgi:hypothetical protein